MTDNDPGVTTIELFFDLVFVFTITQLTHAVAQEPTITGVAGRCSQLSFVWSSLWPPCGLCAGARH